MIGRNLKERIESFFKTGLMEVTSDSIVQDCAYLLRDLYQAGMQLNLLPKTQEGLAILDISSELIKNQETARQGLLAISDFIAMEFYRVAKISRSNLSDLYDLAKHLQSFHSLLANSEIQDFIRKALKSNLLMMHKESIGIRFDFPGEDRQLTTLHQEFHSFPFGVNAVVLWVPLTRISRLHGTLAYYPRPHLSNPIPFYADSYEQDRLLSEGRLQEAQKCGGLQIDSIDLGAPHFLDVEPGSCFIFSAVLPHSSSPAMPDSLLARLTCQARFFDLEDSFLAWKHSQGRLWDGLKRPSEGWQLWEEFMND